MAKLLGKLGLHQSGYWYCRVNGQMKYITKRGASQEEAEEAYKKLQLEMGTDGTNTIKPEDQSVKALLQLHLDRVSGQTSSKNEKDKTRILNSFCEKFGTLPLKAITPLAIDSWIHSFATRGNGGGAYNRFAHLKAAFIWIKKKLKTTTDPMEGVTTPVRNARGEEFVIEMPEWLEMLPCISQPYRDAAQVCMLTGARMGEILGATVDEYDRDARIIVKKTHKTAKNGGIRIIKLNEEAVTIFEHHIGDRKDGLIFQTKKGGPLCGAWLCQAIQQAAERIGRKKPTCAYSTRHSFACRNLEAGVPIHIVAGWLGHSVTVCEQTYGHTIERLRLREQRFSPA